MVTDIREAGVSNHPQPWLRNPEPSHSTETLIKAILLYLSLPVYFRIERFAFPYADGRPIVLTVGRQHY